MIFRWPHIAIGNPFGGAGDQEGICRALVESAITEADLQMEFHINRRVTQVVFGRGSEIAIAGQWYVPVAAIVAYETD